MIPAILERALQGTRDEIIGALQTFPGLSENMPKKCLICEKEIQVDAIAAYNATFWTTSGNYGSGVYDPLNGRVFLEAIICDECLLRKKELIEEVVVIQPSEIIERRPVDF